MKRSLTALGITVAILALTISQGSVVAKEMKSAATNDHISVTAPWTRATPKGAKVAGGYVTIANTGSEPDKLIGGSFGAAARVEVHEMAIVNDIMKMRQLPKGLEIGPGKTVELKPGGYHLMFMRLKRQLKAGETVSGTLVFERAGPVEIVYKVEGMGARKGQGSHVGHGNSHAGHGKKMSH